MALHPTVKANGWRLAELAQLGLYVRESEGDTIKGEGGRSYEAAICRVTAAMVQAVAIAIAAGDTDSGDAPGPSWVDDFQFGEDEARIALGGVAAILRNLPALVEDLRDSRPFPDVDGKPEDEGVEVPSAADVEAPKPSLEDAAEQLAREYLARGERETLTRSIERMKSVLDESSPEASNDEDDELDPSDPQRCSLPNGPECEAES